MNIRIAFLLPFFPVCATFFAAGFPKLGRPASRPDETDTVLLRRPFSVKDMYNSARCMQYTASVDGDTSGFRCTVCQSLRTDGSLTLYADGNYPAPVPYREELRLISRVLPLADRDFGLDSLRSVYLGSLRGHADLSIAISSQFFRKYGSVRYPDKKKLEAFLSQSQVVDDFNALLAPYGKKIRRANGAEKLMLMPKRVLDYRAVESDTASIPVRIIDCYILTLEVVR